MQPRRRLMREILRLVRGLRKNSPEEVSLVLMLEDGRRLLVVAKVVSSTLSLIETDETG